MSRRSTARPRRRKKTSAKRRRQSKPRQTFQNSTQRLTRKQVLAGFGGKAAQRRARGR